MGLLDSILGAVTGKAGDAGATAENPLLSALGGLLQQSGGLQGLMAQFSQKGLGDVFTSWVGMGENQAVSAEQIHSVLGNEQVAGLASKLGVDPQQASALLSQYLPKIIDKLTPAGQVGSDTDHQQGLADLLPALMQGGLGQLLGGGSQSA